MSDTFDHEYEALCSLEEHSYGSEDSWADLSLMEKEAVRKNKKTPKDKHKPKPDKDTVFNSRSRYGIKLKEIRAIG